MLPNVLKKALEEEASFFIEAGGSGRALKQGQKQLHNTYQKELFGRHGQETHVKRYAYLLTRFPATYHAVANVLGQLVDQEIFTCLDIGAGSLASSLAAAYILPSLQRVTAIEQDEALLLLGGRLLQKIEPTISQKIYPICQQIAKKDPLPQASLMLFSYSLGEMEEEEARGIVQNAFFATTDLLVIVEPGTPRGFQRVLAMRKELLNLGGNLVAPCPHHKPCPISEGNWCHFSVRLERSFWHRHLKEADLGYEDEKYCYLVVSKKPKEKAGSRVLASPEKHGGHVRLKLCTSEGRLEEKILSKKCGAEYQAAKKLRWGDEVVLQISKNDKL